MKKQKEIGMPKGASKAARKADDAYDKKKGVVEGSKSDLKADKAITARFKKKSR